MGNDGQWSPGRQAAFSYAKTNLKKTYENSDKIPSQIVLQAKF
jgi:hypothetical protein